MKHIAQSPLAAMPLDGFGELFVTRIPAVIVTPAGPRSLGGRWIARRHGVSPASADLLAELIGLGPEARS